MTCHLTLTAISYLAEKLHDTGVAHLSVVRGEEEGRGRQPAEEGAVAQLILPGLLAAPGERQEPLVEFGVVAATVPQEGVPVPQVLVELSAALHAAGEPRERMVRLQAPKKPR